MYLTVKLHNKQRFIQLCINILDSEYAAHINTYTVIRKTRKRRRLSNLIVLFAEKSKLNKNKWINTVHLVSTHFDKINLKVFRSTTKKNFVYEYSPCEISLKIC